MRVLFVTPEFPYPLDQGGRIRMFHLIKHLSERHDIHLISVTLFPVNTSHMRVLKNYCRSVHLVPQPTSIWYKIIRLIRSLITSNPYVIFKHMPGSLSRVVKTVTSCVNPNIIFVESQHISSCVSETNCPSVIDLHDIEYILYDRFADNPRWGLKKIHGRIQRRLMYDFEMNLPKHFDVCITVSSKDRERLQNISGAANLEVVPNGVDVNYFSPEFNGFQQHDLVFVGSMDYYPNIDASLYLCQEVMPHIWRYRPQTTVAIVGRNPTPSIRKLTKDQRVFVTGKVEDVRPYLSGSSIVIVPLRIGGGTRLKVLEAAAMGRAIVGTPIGLEGIDLENGINVFVEKEPERLAKVCLHLLDNPAECQRIGSASRALVVERYSWEASVKQLENVLNRI